MKDPEPLSRLAVWIERASIAFTGGVALLCAFALGWF